VFVHRLAAIAVLSVAWVAWSTPACGQLRIVAYNVNNSDPGNFGPRPGMESVLRGINASAKGGFARPIDVLILGEAESVATTGTAYAALLNTIASGTTYRRATVDAGSTGSGRPIAVYNSAAVTLVAEKKIGSLTGTASHPRQTMRYQFRPVGYDATADFYVYASHFKSSTGGANEAERNNEALAIRADADALGQGANVIYSGDFNFYSSSESGFQTLTGTGNGQAFDPVSRLGSWSGSSTYKDVHTQSPATTAVFNGQVTGGVDDRFDFQLVTGEVRDGRGFDYLAGSYWAFGNTATHAINQAISTGSAATLAARIPGTTTAQASALLTALTQVTDHLPVVADYQLPAKLTATLVAPPDRVVRGAVVSGTLTVANAAPVTVAAGADVLSYGFSGGGAAAALGTGTGMAVALASATSHRVTVSATAVGQQTGTVAVTASGTQTATPTFSGTFSTAVLDHAVASFAAPTTTTSWTIDFGTLIRGGVSGSTAFSIFNRVAASGTAWTSRLDLDGVSSTLPSGVVTTSLAAFTNLAPGGSRSFGAEMTTSTVGTFSGTYTLALSDENLPGAAAQSLSLGVRGTVMPPLAGDLNCDAFIDILDMADFLGAGRFDTGAAAAWADGDFNDDRLVDILDVADLLGADRFDEGDYRPLGMAEVAAVPEPTTQLMLMAAGGAMLWGRRRGGLPTACRGPAGEANEPKVSPCGPCRGVGCGVRS
jgi:hypothetical protein